jgi:hypothetical protein
MRRSHGGSWLGTESQRAAPEGWRRALAVSALIVLSSTVSLCCAEMLIRRLPLLDPSMGVRGLAGRARFIDNPNGFYFYINRLGLRTKDFKPAKEASAVRVVLMGDSHAFGVGVDDEDRVSERLQRVLQGSLRRNVEVLNAAQPGTTWTDYLAAAQTAVDWQPDLLIVLTYTGNDLGELALPTFKQPVGGSPSRDGWLLGNLRRFHIWHLLRRGFSRQPPRRLFRIGKPPCEATLHTEEVGPFAQGVLEACVMSRMARPEELEQRVEQLGQGVSRIARSHRIPLIIAALPPKILVEAAASHSDFDGAAARVGIRSGQALALLERAHRAFCRPVGGAIVIDLFGPLRNSQAGSLYFAHDWHINGEGHRIVAAVLAHEILHRQLLGRQ